MSTIYDVAKAAGVTATTVSNVLSGKGSVSAATRARVMKYVKELEYQPNLVARSLIKGRTGMIGLVVPGLDHPFFAEATVETERLAYAAGLRVFVTTLANDPISKGLLRDLTLRRVDGILVVAGGLSLQAVETIMTERIPVVHCLWEGDDPNVSLSVTVDFAQCGRLAAEHLLSLGHSRFGVVTDISEAGVFNHYLRVVSFREIVSLHGCELDPSTILAGQSSLEEGKKAGYSLLTQPNPPSAIYATNDLMAIGVISAAWELGIRIPQDLSVVGVDDIALAQYTTPPLTSIRINKMALIGQALEILLKIIEGERPVSPPLQPVQVVVRGSTGPCN